MLGGGRRESSVPRCYWTAACLARNPGAETCGGSAPSDRLRPSTSRGTVRSAGARLPSPLSPVLVSPGAVFRDSPTGLFTPFPVRLLSDCWQVVGCDSYSLVTVSLSCSPAESVEMSGGAVTELSRQEGGTPLHPRFPVPPAEASAHPPSALGIRLFRTFHTVGPCVPFATDGFRLTASSRLTDQGGRTFGLRSARDGQPGLSSSSQEARLWSCVQGSASRTRCGLGALFLPWLWPVLSVIVTLSGERLRSRLFQLLGLL